MHSPYKIPILVALGVMILCAVIGAIHVQTVRANSRAQNAKSEISDQFITYRVTGTASRVLLTYTSPPQRRMHIQSRLPWKKNVQGKPGDFAFLSAESCDKSASVTTEILVNGVSWKKTTSEPMGTYALADCDGFLEKAD